MNKINLIGRLVRDPELKYTITNNKAVANFTLAVKRRMAREGQQQADFINIVAWGTTAEFVAKYFKKGLQVALSGRLQTRDYENSEGKKIYVTEVVAEEVYFADSKKDEEVKIMDWDDIPAKNPDGESNEELPF